MGGVDKCCRYMSIIQEYPQVIRLKISTKHDKLWTLVLEGRVAVDALKPKYVVIMTSYTTVV